MALNYAAILHAVVARLVGDATLGTNIGDRLDLLPTPTGVGTSAIYLERAPSRAGVNPSTGVAQSYAVVSLLNSPEHDVFTSKGLELNFGVDLWFPGVEDPYAVGDDASVVLDQIRTRLEDHVLSLSGATASGIVSVDTNTAHEDEAWHWIKTFRVWIKET